MTMVPEAWQNDVLMPADKKAFYRWSAFAMEPWDGPGKNLSMEWEEQMRGALMIIKV